MHTVDHTFAYRSEIIIFAWLAQNRLHAHGAEFRGENL